MPRSRSSGALSIWSKATYLLAALALASTLVMAAVKVVFPWSTCPIVPTFTCGFVRSNFCLAISELLLTCGWAALANAPGSPMWSAHTALRAGFRCRAATWRAYAASSRRRVRGGFVRDRHLLLVRARGRRPGGALFGSGAHARDRNP